MPLDLYGPPTGAPQGGPPGMPPMPGGNASGPMPGGAMPPGAAVPGMPMGAGAQSVIPPQIRAQLPPQLQGAPDAIIFQFLEQWQRSKGDMFTPPGAPPAVPNAAAGGPMPPQQML